MRALTALSVSFGILGLTASGAAAQRRATQRGPVPRITLPERESPIPRRALDRPPVRLRGFNVQAACSTIDRSAIWSIQGTLITPAQVIPQGMVTIGGKMITAVRSVGPGSFSCSTKVDGIILPGLIDLHNHLTWNVFPRWHPPKHYSRRYEWQHSPEFTRDEAHDDLYASPQVHCQANLYGEVKALAGGATSVVGSDNHSCVAGLIRNLDYDSGLLVMQGAISPSLQAAQNPPALTKPCVAPMDNDPIVDVADNEINPLELTPQRVEYLKCHLISGSLRSLLVHLAEGRPDDRPSWSEFGKLQALGLLREGLVIVHGTALHEEDFAAMKNAGVGLVWSPRSEIELYGATLNILAAQNAGVAMAIAPDWSITGSDGMLQELNYARVNFGQFNAEQLTAMATDIPARFARIDDRIGQLKVGLYADLLVIRSKGGSAYESVVTASPADVQLVVIDGRPLYGDIALMQQLLPGKTLVPLTICGASKAIDLGGTIAVQSSWDAVKAALQDRLSQDPHPLNLAPLACPGVSKSEYPANVR